MLSSGSESQAARGAAVVISSPLTAYPAAAYSFAPMHRTKLSIVSFPFYRKFPLGKIVAGRQEQGVAIRRVQVHDPGRYSDSAADWCFAHLAVHL